MQSKKALGGLLAMSVILALAALGLVYTNWAQNLTINGNVQTGKIAVNFAIQCDDVDPAICVVDNETGPTSKIQKDIGLCTISQPNAKTIEIKISNGYPGFKCHFWTDITNKSKLPVEVTNVVTNNNGGAIKVFQVPDGLFNADEWSGGFTGFPKGDCKQAQLNLNQTTFCDWEVEVNKTAEQNTTYNFSIAIKAELLNKGP